MSRGIRRIVKVAVAALVPAALVVGTAVLVQRRKAALADAPRYGLAPTPVRVATVWRGSLKLSRDYLAVVEPVQTASLSARLTSRVESVAVEESQQVRAGEPLVLLDDREIVNAIGAAQAQIAHSQAELAANEATVSSLEKSAAFYAREAERKRQLLVEEAATVSETEAAIDKAEQFAGQLAAAESKSEALRQQINSLVSRVDELRTRKGYCEIVSPFDGVVARRHVDPGDQAAPGKPLLVVEDRRRMKLAFDIPQQDVPDVRAGMPVLFKGPDASREATVTNIFPSLNQARMLRAEVFLQGPVSERLDTGVYLGVTVVLQTWEEATLIPASALVESPEGDSYVFVVADGRLRPARITVLGRSRDEVAVEGVEPGEDVVLSTFLGWSRLSSDLAVEAVR